MNKTKSLLLSSLLLGLTCLTACNDDNITITNDLEGVIIFQAYGTGGKDDCPLSNSFVELYNTTSTTIDLNGSSIQYSEEGNEWTMFELSGTIDPSTSFLITFDECETSSYDIKKGDLSFDYEINNKGIKFCLVDNTELINVINPFTSNIDGYIDMVCATDSASTIDAYETDYVIGQSKQKSIRRTSLIDTNNNSLDFEIVDYSILTNTAKDNYSPKNQAYSTHNPIIESVVEETSTSLLIYQVYGTGGKSDSAINRSYIELYNNSSVDINLDSYTISYMSVTDETWSVISLSGVIPAYSSYLIVGTTSCETGVYGTITEADLFDDFELSNDGFVVCLLSDDTNLNDTLNPFESEISSYVDMLGSEMAFCENTAADKPSKQKTVIRTSFEDTNNNSIDFTTISFKDDESAWNIYAPKTSTYGEWTL